MKKKKSDLDLIFFPKSAFSKGNLICRKKKAFWTFQLRKHTLLLLLPIKGVAAMCCDE